MATWYSAQALDALLNRIKTESTTIHLLDTYSAGQSYATVAGNSIGSASISDSDFTGAVADGNNRKLTFNGKSGSATGNSSVKALHLAITSGSEVLAVTDETSNQDITSGNPITFPSFVMNSNQPTQV